MAKHEWQVQEAKGRFSAVIAEAESSGPQWITKHGRPIAVLLSLHDYEQLSRPAGSSIVDFFANSPLSEIEIPDRDQTDVGREIDF